MTGAAFEGVERWLADARAREAADARVRERWLRQQAQDEADLTGALLDLAERQVDVVALSTTGARHFGRITAVGRDFVAVRTAGGRMTLVTLASLGAVRPVSGSRLAASGPERPASAGNAAPGRGAGEVVRSGRGDDEAGRRLGVSLADVLGHAAGDRPRVQLKAGDVTVTGELRAVGADLATVHADGDPPGIVYARLASVSEVSLLGSG